MAEITAALVKDLREKSGAGMMDCKKALTECDGDLEAAIDWLRTKGLAAAAKLETRSTISVDLMNERLMRGRRSHMTQSIARSLSELAQVPGWIRRPGWGVGGRSHG